MAATTFTDLIDKSPTYLPEYFEANLPEKTVLVSSGLAASSPQVDSAIKSQGGKTVAMNFFKEFTTAWQVLAADTDLTVRAMSSDSDIGVICARGVAVGEEDVAKILAMANPLQEFARQITNSGGRMMDTALIKALQGARAAAGSGYLKDNSTEDFDYNGIIQAVDLLGDESDKLSIILAHSKVYHRMQALKLVQYGSATPIGAGSAILDGGFIGNRRVFVSDQLTTSGSGESTVYSTYIGSPGAMTLAFQKNITVEPYRLPLKAGGTSVLVVTVHFVPHLNYVKFDGTPSGLTPTDTELATESNWTSVAGNTKDIRLVELKTKATF